MTVFLRLLGGLSLFLLTCMLICGLWVASTRSRTWGSTSCWVWPLWYPPWSPSPFSSLPRADAGAFPTKKTAAGAAVFLLRERNPKTAMLPAKRAAA